MPPRPLKRKTQVLPNGVVLHYVPVPGDPEHAPVPKEERWHKGRHWVASYAPEDPGPTVVVGEFRSRQLSHYERQDKDWGRGGGTYSTSMWRESWAADQRHEDGKAESAKKPNRERVFDEWRHALRQLEPARLQQLLAKATKTEGAKAAKGASPAPAAPGRRVRVVKRSRPALAAAEA